MCYFVLICVDYVKLVCEFGVILLLEDFVELYVYDLGKKWLKIFKVMDDGFVGVCIE